MTTDSQGQDWKISLQTSSSSWHNWTETCLEEKQGTSVVCSLHLKICNYNELKTDEHCSLCASNTQISPHLCTEPCGISSRLERNKIFLRSMKKQLCCFSTLGTWPQGDPVPWCLLIAPSGTLNQRSSSVGAVAPRLPSQPCQQAAKLSGEQPARKQESLSISHFLSLSTFIYYRAGFAGI